MRTLVVIVIGLCAGVACYLGGDALMAMYGLDPPYAVFFLGAALQGLAYTPPVFVAWFAR
ncbi:MAG: hypothetical protein R3B40_32115 [Polyangiales bacterium]|nr:hypothetical protein [Myxococcales bacterium]MCB9661516.1 hypothetical protein [Sandaracinaceae bacterium]